MGQHTGQQWDDLWRTIKSGQEALINKSLHEYFLGILPPKYISGNRFVFSDGPTWPTLFVHHGGEHYTMQGFVDFNSLYEHTGIVIHYQG
jgi:hypothetical protein